MRLIDVDPFITKLNRLLIKFEDRKSKYTRGNAAWYQTDSIITIIKVIIKVLNDPAKTPIIEAEPVRHGRWVDRYGGKYANHLYECSECKGTALYKYEVDVLDNGHFVQALSDACPHCRAKMDGDRYDSSQMEVVMD